MLLEFVKSFYECLLQKETHEGRIQELEQEVAIMRIEIAKLQQEVYRLQNPVTGMRITVGTPRPTE